LTSTSARIIDYLPSVLVLRGPVWLIDFAIYIFLFRAVN
jgi:hypothetical protein